MKLKIAINGFGRIGRLTLRSLFERNINNIEILAVNDLADISSNIHLFKYDSVHGIFNKSIFQNENNVEIDGKKISFFSESNPENLPWKEMGIDLVIESTGIFTKKDKAKLHINSGAKKVLISAPSPDADITVVFGVNHKKIKKEHKIVSNGSCTTNCLAPVAYILDEKLGIKSGYMTTVHSVTGDQSTIDTFHKDLRRARNSSLSMIPTSTGAARAVGDVLPNLIGKLEGSAIRVPTANVSLIDFCFESTKKTSVNDLNNLMVNSSENEFKGILQTSNDSLVSCDFNHNSHSSIIDLKETKVINGNFCRLLSWYDNEWGFSNRLIDVALKMF